MAIVRLVAGALLVGINLWLAGAAFEPIARDGGAVEYVLVSPSFLRLVAYAALSAAALLMVQALLAVRRAAGPPEPFLSAANTSHLRPLAWLGLSLLPLANLVAPSTGPLPALSYVLFDLRWYWWPLVLVDVLNRLDVLVRPAGAPRAVAPPWIIASLVVIPVAGAVAFTPILRFSGVLHGDEPKYIRYCENFYQGFGFDVSKHRLLTELPPNYEPRVFDNVRHLLRAAPEEAALLAADVRRLIGVAAPRRLVAEEPSAAMVFAGKHPGTVYQLHNPGLSLLLFPGYYIDRRVTGGGLGYRNEFPASMPAVHVTLLALYAGYALALYALVHTYGGNRAHAWILSLVGVLALPAGAFAFQIYPEIAAGLIIFVLVREIIAPVPRAPAMSLAFGLVAGFLPWLHIRFGLVAAVIIVWRLTTRAPDSRARRLFAVGSAAALAGLSLYTYRLTGSLLPTATYGADAPLTLARVLNGIPGFALDRVWGVIPHSPVYLLALPGVGLAWRRRRTVLVWILALFCAVAVPAAGHGFQAAGATPGRYLVAIAPLLLLFIADAMAAWSRRRLFVAAFVVLTLASIETAVRYNLHHAKDAGALLAREFSGWRFNLLFPSVGTAPWPTTPRDVALLTSWAVIALLLVFVPWWRTRRRLEPIADDRPTTPAGLGAVFIGLFAVTFVAMIVSRATGETIAREYLLPAKEARERALSVFASLPRCALCYSSAMGAVEPTTALGNVAAFVDLRTEPASARAGQRVRIRVRPRSPEREYLVSTVRLDLGDGSTRAYHRLFGDVDAVHVYEAPGDYAIYAWVKASSDQPAEARLTLHVDP